ncbi:uncharacterized protein BDZ99DRAFT_551725 [Mytilinidion resinicola]|uniref:Zn(2)-C6 fungal-type domain-containing protein n=1 Tax=Mytilinidion resinicola TaxID=574789 RepID=A0A6A6Y297_9PEZI|nr:uncharacterized protein BDZ99DRAFT_551725 [Mytilinidion resinicola]KAF2802345.1 hypothetical protein BDZ99DRAFT_551725 [Mytilinidion resinicola]
MATDPVRPSTHTRKAKTQTSPDMRVPRRKFANKRAPLACQFCRKRKVRCDAAVHGQPCSNCRHDGYTCEMSVKKEKPPRLTDLRTSRPGAQNGLPARQLHASASHFSYCSSEVSSSAASFGGAIVIPESDYERDTDYGTTSSASTTSMPPPMNPSHNLTSDLPPYIRPLSPDLGPDEISYLRKKGALTVPEKWLREKLMQCYMECVHWHVPAVSLSKVVETIQRGDGMTGKISLMLLQAIMFTGVGFVQEEHLEAAGFTSREHAQRVLFNRVKLLYDLDCETDRMTVIQSLLLMAFGCSGSLEKHEKDTWHWLGISTSLCYGSRLNRYPGSGFMTPEKRKLWKRIWWSCYALDQMTALRLHRRPRIHRQDFNVPMLTLEDFEVEGLKGTLGGNVKQCAVMYVDKVYLCLHIGWPEPERLEKGKRNTVEQGGGEMFADMEMFADLVEIPGESADWEQGLEWVAMT